jgi:hypothetical protein
MSLMTKFILFMLLLLFPISANAYIGPGVGLGAIGSAIAVLGALILLIVGFIWYPLKRLLRRRKAKNTPNNGVKS